MNKNELSINTYNSIVNEWVQFIEDQRKDKPIYFYDEILFLLKNIKDGAYIVDAGCAIGNYTNYLDSLNRNFNVLGIDASPNMIDKANKLYPNSKYAVGNLIDCEFEKKSVDAIICLATLIHVNDNECRKILTNFINALKDDGIIMINIMEIKDKKEEIRIEEFNTKYRTYYNFYKKEFFVDFFKEFSLDLIKEIDKYYDVADVNEMTLFFRKKTI